MCLCEGGVWGGARTRGRVGVGVGTRVRGAVGPHRRCRLQFLHAYKGSAVSASAGTSDKYGCLSHELKAPWSDDSLHVLKRRLWPRSCCVASGPQGRRDKEARTVTVASGPAASSGTDSVTSTRRLGASGRFTYPAAKAIVEIDHGARPCKMEKAGLIGKMHVCLVKQQDGWTKDARRTAALPLKNRLRVMVDSALTA